MEEMKNDSNPYLFFRSNEMELDEPSNQSMIDMSSYINSVSLDYEFLWPNRLFRVFVANVEIYKSSPDSIWECLSSKELMRASRFYHVNDRMRFLIGRHVVRNLLGRYHNVPAADVDIQLSADGRPEYAGPLDFNVSHSGDRVLCGLSYSANIGVDVEEINSNYPEEVIETIFSDKEQDEYAKLVSRLDKTVFFYKIWTRKEAVLKAIGKGFLIDPRLLCVLNTNGTQLTNILFRGECYVVHDWMDKDYACAVAVGGRA